MKKSISKIRFKNNNKPISVVGMKHKQVLENLTKKVGKHGKNTMLKAMMDVGYSKNYAKSGNIVNKKSWKQITQERFEDDLLIHMHHNLFLFSRVEHLSFDENISDQDIRELITDCGGKVKKIIRGVGVTQCYFIKPDYHIQKKALELAYKIKGKIGSKKLNIK